MARKGREVSALDLLRYGYKLFIAQLSLILCQAFQCAHLAAGISSRLEVGRMWSSV